MTNRTLIDASVLIGFWNNRDIHHKRANEIMSSIEEPIITDYLIDEFLSVITRKITREHAIAYGSKILTNGTQMTMIGPVEFARAWELFVQSKRLSFTDCTNIAVMRSLSITHIATFDKSFDSIDGITVIS